MGATAPTLESSAMACASFTVSVGVATREAAAGLGSVKDLVERADQALYAAKAGGRNCVRDHVRDHVRDDAG